MQSIDNNYCTLVTFGMSNQRMVVSRHEKTSVQYLAKIPPLCPFLSSYQGRVFLLGFEIVLEITSFIDFLVLDLNRAKSAEEKYGFCTVFHGKHFPKYSNRAEGARTK